MNTKCKPRFSLFDELDRGLNHLVNEVLQHEPKQTTVAPVSVHEFDDRYVIECDVPGVALADIEVSLEAGVLQISGTRNVPESEDATVTVNERVFGGFHRKLQLGKELDVDSVDAELGIGVLTITVNKSARIRSRSIKVRSAESS